MVNRKHTQQTRREAGFSLLLAMIVASVALSIGIALLGLTVKQLDLSVTARDSEVAFHVASAGIECLQWFRYQNANDLLQNDDRNLHDITVRCFGQTIAFNDQNSNNRREYDVSATGSFGGSNFCVQMDLGIVTVDASNRSRDFGSFGVSGDCPEGDACTVAHARGYNVPCNASGDPVTTQFSVQRELTAEF